MSSYDNAKVIGFDLDQTLYPRSPDIDQAIQSYIYVKISEHKRCSLEEAKKLFTDLYQGGKGLGGGQTLLKLGIPGAREIVQEALEHAPIARFLKPNEKVLETLNKLKEKYQSIDLITGSGSAIAIEKMKELEIPKETFTHYVTAEDGSKSQGTSYEFWMSYYPDLRPQNFLYIGDRPRSDCEVPTKMGMQAILVNVAKADTTIPCPQFSSFEKIGDVLL